ncbi:hypothetical protein LAZ67_12002747, partial [Cordylochernes scorpioides]
MEDDHRPTVSGSYLPCQRQRDPSTFSGDGNINPGQWLKEYERVSKYNRWDETMKLANVVFYLNGTAGRWFDNNEESLNSWRSFEDAFRGVFGLQEDSARRAEEVLKSRAQKAEESSESYIQEILSLCHQVNPRMEEGEIVAHIIKGISEDTYQVLVAKDIQTVDEILKFCRHLTTVKQRRIGRTKFARLSNVMPISCVDDSDDLAGLIRRIVREEIQKVFSAPEVVNPLREVNALEQTVREEVSRALQPTRPQVNVVQQQPRTPYYNIDRPTQPRKTEHWRTYDDKPICFHCGRPGHVVRYCRERRQVFAEARSRNGGEGRNGFSSRPPRYDADDDYVTPQTSTLIESSDKLQETQLKSREWSQKINLTLDPGLSEIQRLQLVSCLDEFIDIFDFGSTPIKPTSTVKHKINTGDQSPIKQRPYRVAPSERRLIQDEVNKMIENHIVKPSESPRSSPVILVRKKDGTWRFCVDYRRLNKITKKDVYPLPRIDDALDSLAGSSYFSTMDLRSGYWQIEVDEKDREKTAFITPDGLYEFQVMPFGLCNAPATFERMIDSVLGSLKWNMCLCYLDDIVVYAPTFEEHLRRLQLVLSCIQKAGLSLNHKKCIFGSRRIKILGHLVDANGIHPDPDKVEAVSKFPRPRNISELKSFLGLCSYYQRFIENFADKARSLHDLLKTEKQFYWDAAQEKAFEVLKTALISEPVSGHFDESADTHLHTDASGHGIGAVLLQIQGGKERPIAYASRSLTKAENNYSTTEKECLAVVWSISKFRPYLFGRPFRVVTDHHSLCWLHQKGFQHYRRHLIQKNYSTTGRPWLMMIPKHLRSEVMADLHDAPTAGHLGFARTYDKVKKRFYWPGLYRTVRQYVSHCRECQRRKKLPRRPAGQLVSIPPVEKQFHKVGVDLLGRFPVSKDGNRWIIVCTDYMTRYAITKAIPDGGAIETAKFLVEDVILKHGAPREMITDRGRNFISQVIKDINALCGIVHRFTTAYHPQTNGLTERFNKTLGDMLSMYTGVEQKDWDQVLPYVTFAYNTAKQEATGYTPFFLVHAREAETYIDAVLPYLPDEISNDYVGELVTRAEEARQLSRSRLLQSQAKDRRLYDHKHTPVYYQKDDLVWVFTPIRKVGLSEKLLKRYFDPYKVTKKLSEVTYEVEPVDPSPRSRKSKDIVHVIRMKPYLDPEEQHSILLGNTGPRAVFSVLFPLRVTLKVGNKTSGEVDKLARVSSCTVGDLEDPPLSKISFVHMTSRMVETRSGKMQDPAQERIQAEESAKPQPGATIGRDASSDPVVLNPNIDIPKYDGTEDPRPWIESLEEIGFLYHWADYIISRYAAMNMTGSAKTWLNLHKASFTSWENIKIRLIQDFSLDANKEELRMKLNRMQHWNEPAIRFAEDILVLCNKVDPAMEEETKIEHVIGGLKKEYSFALYLNPPKTTDDLLVVCKKMDSFEKKYRERVEKSRNLYNGPRYSRPQQQSRYVPPTAARNYQTTSRPQAPVSNNYKNDSPPSPRQYRNNFPQPSTPRRPYTPNFVPKPNLQRNTYNKSQEVSKNRTEDGRPICFKCNKPGHVARYCRVKFIRILEEDPADTQEKVEEKCQMNEISEKSGPRLYADIGTFEALVDTGADLSVVDLRTALDTGHGISKLAKICAGPDGKKLDMVGSIFLNIKIDDETLSHNFVILKTHLRTLILGRDFLKKMNAKIDCKQETIKYDSTNNHEEINFEMLKIKSAKDSIVPECSMKLIKALVETEDGEYTIEESSKMFQTNGLRLARSLINVINRETHIWITNPYPRPLKIMKNQTLAFGSSPAKINVSREREVEKNEEPRFQINENLSPKEQKELKQVLERYGDLFSSRLGRTNLAKHRIDTEDAKPIKHKPYRVSAKERDIIKEEIDEMLTEGIIRPSSSPWSFPVILVKKRDGKYRFCVDYRKLNNVTVKDVYPIPRIDEVMDTLQGSTHFSAIDLRSGYWQVEVEERDKEKTAFTTAHGLYEFNVMPFGLCNAPATFERNMENMLGNLRWQICLCYLDDVIIYSPDFPTHLKRLEAVFRCFRESNLRLNDKKCRFVFEELEILGYITSKHGIKPAEHNIKAVRNFPRPKKVKEVQSFLGMCSYYRKFIKDFSKIADPLTNLIKKSVSFTWTERQEEAFQTLKTALLSPPILGHFNPNAPTYVHTDASNIGIGATLVQDIGGEEKVISYLSRTLSKAEQNYSTTEKECLAVVWSMSKLRPYLYGRHFKIVTDHHALCWLKNLKDPTDEEDKFIESVKKNLNGSRRSIAQNFKEEDGCLFKKNPNPEGRAWLLVIPENKKREIMKEYHNHMSNGHLGVARTMYRIKSKYFWPSMLKDVSEFVKTCHLCQSRKGSNQLPSGLLQPIPPANFPFERIGIDFVGPLPSTKNRKKWIIVLTDYYTRYAETRAVSEATVKEVSKFLVEDIFLRHGAPQYLISDRGSQFTSNLMKEVMKTCKIKHCFTTSYHPQTNGLTERLNRTLINMLSMYVNTDQKNWDEILPFITHAYNTTIQETTGYSPFFLMFGREPTSLLDDRNISVDIDKDDYDEYIKHHLDKINRTRKLVINNTIKTQERMKKNYDKKHMERSYEPGELVAVWTPIRKIGKCEKLLRKYFGPYRILADPATPC